MAETVKSKSGKDLAVATGTLTLRLGYDEHAEDNLDAIIRDVEGAIDATILHRIGSVTTRHNDTVLELRCDVEYGPVFGAHESDLLKHAKTIASRLKAHDRAITNVRRRELTSADVDELRTKADDLDTPLSVRVQLEKTIKLLG